MATKGDRKRKGGEKQPKESANLYRLAVNLLGIGFGLLHRWHVSTLFENDRHFSHLSEVEREMSFRTEMGMYYSYYKTIVESKNFVEGFNKLNYDNLSEYGNVINANQKYSLLPEVTAGLLYHTAKSLGIVSGEQCWQIERGDGLSSVTSCEGLGVPVYFYLETVWISTIFTAALLFYYATFLGDSIYSGVMAILLFFYNHNECTRVQWTPPLRESFAYPMLLSQMYTVSHILRKHVIRNPQPSTPWKEIDADLLTKIQFATMISLGSWQFSHFVFATQIIALLLLKWSRVIPNELYLSLCLGHGVGVIGAVASSNVSMLFSSVYMCLLITSTIISYISFTFVRLKFHDVNSKFLTFWEINATLIISRWLKMYLFTSEDDAHVFNILKSKLTDYKDFHTMLYTCSPEFDFMQYRTYVVIIQTLLLPTATVAGILALYYWYRNFKTEGYPECVEPEMAYNGLQTGAFIIMAVFIMRLKLFMTPHLCIIAGTVCSKKFLDKIDLKGETARAVFVIFLLAGMSYHGVDRLQEEHSFIGEYSNIEQEELFDWIKTNTPKNAVFAGKMSLMANLMLSTRRAIVNNPYYENKEMRDRTMKVYEIFSRKDAASVYVTLRNMQVGYVVLEEPLCLGYADLRPGCQMLSLWDMIDNGAAKASGKPPLCPYLFHGNAYPFRRAFVNSHYVVLQLEYSQYVEFKPKTSAPLHYQA